MLVFFTLFSGCGNSDSQDERAPWDSYDDSGTSLSENRDAAGPQLTPQEAALVNGEGISMEAFAARLHLSARQFDDADALDRDTLNRLRESTLQELINERLIAQQAVTQQVSVSDDEIQRQRDNLLEKLQADNIQTVLDEQGLSYEEWEESQRNRLLQEKLIDLNMGSMIHLSQEEVRQAYEQNRAEYEREAQVRAAQILTYEESRAQQALEALQSGADFAQVARKYSESQDAGAGGDLGFFEEGVMPPELDDVIFSLEVGDVSPIVKTPYGYQIVTLLERRSAGSIRFEDAKAQIEERLIQQKRMVAIDRWMLELRKEATILINESALRQIQ